ncbi:MAG: regulatory protein RecX [Gammaproteobacteria bacterium]|nr:regulatory protein RecX [Gammaproteobacteria bacterium]
MNVTVATEDGGADDGQAAFGAAVRLLALREHTRLELQRKLVARGWRNPTLNATLDRLEGEGLLSDYRFAGLLLAQRVRRGYGPLKVRAELAQRGVDAQIVERIFDESDVDWPVCLRDTAARRFGADEGAIDHRERVRRGRQLTQRGFPVSLVRNYLDTLARA